jgi:RNA polymerase subunit RPABC4/transcription elongation factor Spt4
MARAGGMRTLLEDGIDKTRQGVTSLDEILRVIGSQNKFERPCPNCHSMIDLTFLYCPFRGVFKKNICTNCMGPMEDDWNTCPTCGMSANREQDKVRDLQP